MKKLVFALCAAVTILQGCKENDAQLVYGPPATDSVYYLSSSAIPAADPHNVLVEEFTGQSCSNCPTAHQELVNLEPGGQLIAVGLYIFSTTFPQTQPIDTSKYDLRDSFAADINNDVFAGVVTSSGIPSGDVDRVPVNSKLLCGSSDWPGAIGTQKTVTDSINLALESSYEGGVVNIKATVTYLKAMATKQNLTIVITEDSVIDVQESFPGTIPAYVFTDICRGKVSNQSMGDPILDTMAVKKAGTVYWRKYKYIPTLVSASTGYKKRGIVNVNHCNVVAFVNAPGTNGDFHVLQSWKVKMVP